MQKNIETSKKNIKNLLFIIISALLLVIVLFRSSDLGNIIDTLNDVNLGYIACAIFCMLIFWFLEALMLYKLMLKYTEKNKGPKLFFIAFRLTMVGQYYSNITPGASGGQPVQLYEMKTEDIPLGNGTAILLEKFLLFQIGVTLYSLILLIFMNNNLMLYSKSATIFVYLGLIVNIVMVTAIILIAVRSELVKGVILLIAELLNKIHIIKNLEKVNFSIDSFIDGYNNSVKKMGSDVLMTAKMFFLTFLQLTAFFSITFFIYRALGLKNVSVFEIICLQAFVYMSVCFIPIPGSMGVSEMCFVMIFGYVFSHNIIMTALLLWRGVSYYFSLIFSGVFVVIMSGIKRRYLRRDSICV